MNYHQFNRFFKEVYPNYRELSRAARRTYWNNLLDSMHRDGTLPDRCLNWTPPRFITA